MNAIVRTLIAAATLAAAAAQAQVTVQDAWVRATVAGQQATGAFMTLTASTDSVYSHKGWCDAHGDLAGLKYPMLADTTHELSRAYGVLKEDMGVAYRGTFIIDPNGVVRWTAVNDLSVGRSVEECLRVLDALQTDKLCPCNWKSGETTLN